MTDVEQKVVQMRFDDKEFDEKARKTMKTLDKLADKLSFDEVAKRSDAAFKEVTENVEKIADQAYTIIDRVIDKIRNDIADKLVGYIKSATIDQVANGWQKYSDMTTAVGTLLSQGHKIEKVNKTLEDLSYFADETSYSFNDMLSGISKFTASGVKLEDAKVALMGISNWAAQSGQNAETASHVFGQLAQAMGSYMKKQDWQSVQTANMDTREFRQTALDTAVAMGTLKKVSENTYVSLRATTKAGAQAFTIDDFANSLTQGAWMTSEVMTETYKKYAVAVERIKEIYDNTDEKTGTIIRQRQSINKDLIKKYSEIYKVTEETAQKELDKWSSVKKATDEEVKNYATLNKISEELADKKINATYYNAVEEYSKRTRKSMLETEKDLEQWSEYVSEFSLKAFLNAQEARTFTDVISSVKESAASAWREIYTAIFGDYNEAKVLWTDLAEGLIEIFTDRLYAIADIFSEWKEAGGRTTMLQGMYAFGGGIKMFIDEIRAAWDDLITDGESGVNVLLRISEKIREAGFRFYLFMEALRDNGVFKNIAEALHNIKVFIDQVFGALYDGVRDAIPGGNFFLTLLIDFTTLLKDLTANFKLSDTALEGLRKTFKGVFIILNHSKKTIMDLLIKVVLPVLNVVFSVLGNIMDVVLTLTGTIGDIIEYFMPLDGETSGWIKALSALADILGEVIKLIGNGLSWVLQKLIPIIGVAIGSVTSLAGAIGELFNAKKIKMGSGSNLMKGFSGLKDKILEAWEPLKSFSEIIDQYKNGKGLTNFLNLFTDITDGIGNRLLLTMDATVGFIETLGESKFGKALKGAIAVLRWVIRAGLWLFNNLLVPALKEIVIELGLTIESVKGIIDERGILGLLDLIQEVFKTGIFGSLVNTINLINSVIGSNGVGKLFSKGAKALESISSYFNAAKMNQAADVMLKIVAAMGLLYTLLALITFFPVENYERMKQALVDFGIALGVVVGGVFVISAAAALAGGNLIAMAAGFVGVAVAITTALWALNAMVEWLEKVDANVIKAGLDQLKEILSVYAMFMLKTIAPLALFAGKMQADVGGVGIAMAGLAASIWILLKSLKDIDKVDPNQLDKLFQFLSGIYAVLAASTALMLFGAQGKSVHGISIAIASIGVSFAAIKLILPLCKDVIAEKDVFLDGQAALATFGGFVLALSASMYFITSGVNGILSGIASILLFKGFLNVVMNNLLPVVEAIARVVVEVSEIFRNGLFSEEINAKNIVSAIAAIAVIAGAIMLLIREFRLIFEIWAEMDAISILAVAGTVIGALLIISNKLLPAIATLNEDLKNNTFGDSASLIGTLFLAFSPVFAIMLGFGKIMDKYTELYGKWKNAKYSVNVGLITREFNGAASVMQSIMFTIVGVYAAILGLYYMASKLPTPTEGAMSSIKTLLWFAIGILAVAIIPMLIFFGEVMSNMYKQLEGFGTINKKTLLLKNKEDTFTAVIRSIANTIQMVAAFLPLIMLATAGLSAYVAKTEYIKQFEEIFSIIAGFLIGTLAVVAIIVFKMMGSLEIAANLMSSANSSVSASYTAIASAIAVTVLGVGVLFSIIMYAAYQVAQLNNENGAYDQFVNSLTHLGIMLVVTLGSIAAFIWAVMKIISKYQIMSSYSGTAVEKQFSASWIPLLVAIGGTAAMLLIIGNSILPAIKELESMDFGKITGIFTQVLLLIGASLLPMVVTMILGEKDTIDKFGGILSLLKMIIATVGPLLTVVLSLNALCNIMNAMQGLDSDAVSKLKDVLIVLDILVAISGVLGLIAGAVPHFTAGIAVAGFLLLSIGAMALMISIAAEKIYGIYKDWTGITNVIGKMGQLRSQAMADGQVKGIEDNTDAIIKAQNDQNEAIEKADAKFWGRKSPDKKTQGWGKWLDLGLAKGITDHTKEVKRAIDGTAKITSSVFEEDLEIASPSKVFYKNGRFIVAGLQEGITSKKTSLADTMSDLGGTLSKSIEDGFSGLDIDIFGGKTMEDFIHEFTGGEDAGSIIGKMFGLDQPSEADAALIEKYQNELAELNKANPNGPSSPFVAQRMDWLKAQIDTLSNKSLGAKIGDKISGLLKSDTVKNLISDAAKALGIEVTDSMTSETVLDHLGEKILGKEGDRTVVGEIVDKISSGDWVGVGESIGSGIITGLGAILKEKIPNVTRLLKRINPFADKEVGTYFDVRNLEGGLSVWESDSDTFANFQGHVGKAMFKFDKSFNDYTADQVMNAINIDYKNRMKEFAAALDNAKVWDEYTKTWIYHIDESCEAAIKELFKKWGIASPSKVTTYAYEMVGKGGVVGIEKSTPKLIKAMEDQNSEEYRTMSLGLQAIDQLADPDNLTIQPRLVPIIDTASMAAFTGITDIMSGTNSSKISASLDYSGSMSFLAAGQAAIVSAVDAMRRDLLASLASGELVKVVAESKVDDNNLFDHFINIERQEYNRTGRHAW